MPEAVWIVLHKPEQADDGSYYRQRYWFTPDERALLKVANEARCLWTIVDGDDGLQVAQGFHLVNRLYHIICTVPYAEGATIEVLPDTDW